VSTLTVNLTTPTTSDASREATTVRSRVSLAIVVLVATLCNTVNLTNNDLGNLYYSAAVKSMMQNWHAFFFASFDASGFVTVDKPPVALWIQTISAKIFGFNSLSLLLPEAIAGILAAALLYHMVQRRFGTLPALIAGIVLALMPVSAAVNRDNTVDAILVLVVLGAAWALLNAAEEGSLRWLLLSAVLIGIGFNVKMLEAYLVVPALALVYLVGAPISWRKRFTHLLIAGVIMAVVSLSWVVIVDATPADQRPYVGSSQTNSEIELAFGYNGIQRLLGNVFRRGPSNAAPTAATREANGGFFSGETGTPGFSRMINTQLGGQASWLLPLALIGLLGSVWGITGGTISRAVSTLRRRERSPDNDRAPAIRSQGQTMLMALRQMWNEFVCGRMTPQQQSWLLWSFWFLTCAGFFSVAEFFHAYYLSIIAPAIAAMSGVAIVTLWHDFRSNGWRSWLLPFALVLTAALQVHLLSGYSDYGWITPVVLIVTIASAALFLFLRIARLPLAQSWAKQINTLAAKIPAHATMVALLLSTVALLIAPAAWTIATINKGGNQMLPTAGPTQNLFGGLSVFGNTGGNRTSNNRSGNNITRNTLGGAFGGQSQANDGLIKYLEENKGNAKWIVATTSAQNAESLIISSNEAVMALGGFSGNDPILTTDKLAQLVKNGQIRFFLLQSGFGRQGGFSPDQIDELPPQFQDVIDEFGGRSPGGAGGFGGFSTTSALTQWVTSNCKAVPQSAWESTGGQAGGNSGFLSGAQQLYDCGSLTTTAQH
jgi:4-amino-4-deoxy-L-arabinose transferase-like glycosyltransferase